MLAFLGENRLAIQVGEWAQVTCLNWGSRFRWRIFSPVSFYPLCEYSLKKVLLKYALAWRREGHGGGKGTWSLAARICDNDLPRRVCYYGSSEHTCYLAQVDSAWKGVDGSQLFLFSVLEYLDHLPSLGGQWLQRARNEGRGISFTWSGSMGKILLKRTSRVHVIHGMRAFTSGNVAGGKRFWEEVPERENK